MMDRPPALGYGTWNRADDSGYHCTRDALVDPVLRAIASDCGATPSQRSLAYLLAKGAGLFHQLDIAIGSPRILGRRT